MIYGGCRYPVSGFSFFFFFFLKTFVVINNVHFLGFDFFLEKKKFVKKKEKEKLEMRKLTLIPSSRSDVLIEALCSNKAQHIGVANVRHMPQIATLSGVESHGILIKVPRRSKLFMMIGVTTGKIILIVLTL